uniref:Si:dkey-103i16.6 n=1 Tax=Oryzias sinensis TaxID=183150 RepID=A0A8C7ZI12_9TELE
MKKSRSGTVRPAIARITRSSKSQAEHPKPTETQDSEEGLHRKHQKIQTDLTPAADRMSVETKAQISAGGGGDPLPACQTSKADGCSPSSRGVKSSSPHDLLSVARLVKLGRSKNVVVVAGAGISTASGIPDFRTPGTGLYSNLEKYNVPYPEAIFNIDYFSDNPQPFFSLAKVLYPGSHRPNYIHYFIRVLHHKGLLLRMYTQNIDGLEKCESELKGNLLNPEMSLYACETLFISIKETYFKKTKPNIKSKKSQLYVVFFGEDLPRKYFLHRKDFPKADLLIIMGTSLKIEPFASLVNSVRSTVPRLLKSFLLYPPLSW